MCKVVQLFNFIFFCSTFGNELVTELIIHFLLSIEKDARFLDFSQVLKICLNCRQFESYPSPYSLKQNETSELSRIMKPLLEAISISQKENEELLNSDKEWEVYHEDSKDEVK